MKPTVTLRHALTDTSLLAGALPGDTFSTWRTILIGAMGEPLDDSEREVFRRYTGREPPTEPVRELVVVAGRRAGKDKATAVLVAYLATCCRWPTLSRGEVGRIIAIAPDQSQARIQRDYVLGALESSPLLSRHIASTTADSITLDNGIVVEVRAASFRRLRGLTCVAVVASESAYWLNDDSANPDSEILAAVRPTLLTTRGLAVQISTPYAKRGELFDAHRKHYGVDGSPVLVACGASTDFNPTLDRAEIERAYAEDAAAARAEYGGMFRDDIAAFVSREVIMSCVDAAVLERQPRADARYFAFTDPSGGSSDSMTLAIAHRIDDGRVELDLLREVVPPFSPESVVEDFCADLRRYGIRSVIGDRYAGEWPREQFRKRGVNYEPSDLAASDLFRELLPLLNTRTIALLDHPRAINQLASLERRVGRGKDIIDHPRAAKNDIANVIAGVAHQVSGRTRRRGTFMIGLGNVGERIEWQDAAGERRKAGRHQLASSNSSRSVSKHHEGIGYAEHPSRR
jgi:hypothetical protein